MRAGPLRSASVADVRGHLSLLEVLGPDMDELAASAPGRAARAALGYLRVLADRGRLTGEQLESCLAGAVIRPEKTLATAALAFLGRVTRRTSPHRRLGARAGRRNGSEPVRGSGPPASTTAPTGRRPPRQACRRSGDTSPSHARGFAARARRVSFLPRPLGSAQEAVAELGAVLSARVPDPVAERDSSAPAPRLVRPRGVRRGPHRPAGRDRAPHPGRWPGALPARHTDLHLGRPGPACPPRPARRVREAGHPAWGGRFRPGPCSVSGPARTSPQKLRRTSVHRKGAAWPGEWRLDSSRPRRTNELSCLPSPTRRPRDRPTYPQGWNMAAIEKADQEWCRKESDRSREYVSFADRPRPPWWPEPTTAGLRARSGVRHISAIHNAADRTRRPVGKGAGGGRGGERAVEVSSRPPPGAGVPLSLVRAVGP